VVVGLGRVVYSSLSLRAGVFSFVGGEVGIACVGGFGGDGGEWRKKESGSLVLPTYSLTWVAWLQLYR
jgi:hypothetical protein